MKKLALTVVLAAVMGCQPSVFDDPQGAAPSNRFLDGTPGVTRISLESQGWEYVGAAFVRQPPMCEPQTLGMAGAASFAMLRNPTTGEKALCCTYAASLTTQKTSSCKMVDADFSIGPDVFNGEMLE
ncbi:MAG: hypothetical protein AAF771_16785 [Pseudomonadota bacterium]